MVSSFGTRNFISYRAPAPEMASYTWKSCEHVPIIIIPIVILPFSGENVKVQGPSGGLDGPNTTVSLPKLCEMLCLQYFQTMHVAFPVSLSLYAQ